MSIFRLLLLEPSSLDSLLRLVPHRLFLYKTLLVLRTLLYRTISVSLYQPLRVLKSCLPPTERSLHLRGCCFLEIPLLL